MFFCFFLIKYGKSVPSFTVSITSCSIEGDGIVTKSDYIASGSYRSYTDITIGKGITEIGANCFSQSGALKSVTFLQPSHVEIIGNHAFTECSKLAEITLPDSVKSIGSFAFPFTKITKLYIGQSVQYISTPLHYLSSDFKGFNVSTLNDYFCNDEFGTLYNKNKTILYEVASGCDPSFTIPSTVIEIRNNAFHGLLTLSTLHFLKALKSSTSLFVSQTHIPPLSHLKKVFQSPVFQLKLLLIGMDLSQLNFLNQLNQYLICVFPNVKTWNQFIFQALFQVFQPQHLIFAIS